MEIKEKQDKFLAMYEPIHNKFIKYCKAKAYGIIDYKDLVNESILRYYQSFDTLKNKEAFSAFLFKIAANILKNELRNKYKTKSQGLINTKEETVENTAIKNFEIETLYNALSKLPAREEEAIILFEISGYSIKEVAQITNSSISAIKQRLKRGREKLAVLLNNQPLKQEDINSKSKILINLFF